MAKRKDMAKLEDASRRGRKSYLHRPLPSCEGPKLHAFRHQNAPIKWGPRLDGDREDQPETEAFVFEVEIKSQVYALKVFKFFHPSATHYYWGSLLGDSFPLSEAIWYTDPFYAECRAYGRIKEAQDKSNARERLAVRCHGYLFLGKKDVQWLEKEGVDLRTDVLDDELRQVLGGECRVRAIVKDLEAGGSGINSKTVRESFRRLVKLNNLGIYNRDVGARNFKRGRLVDFGSSWTEPHALLRSLDDLEAKDTKLQDQAMFKEVVIEEGISNFRGLPNFQYCKKLRSWDK